MTPATSGKIETNKLAKKGLDYYQKGDYQKALHYFNRALKNDPKNADLWNNKGIVLKNMGRLEKSLECYNRAIEINPDYEDAWYNKGNLVASLGRINEAKESYQKAIELNPSDEDAIAMLQWCEDELKAREKQRAAEPSKQETPPSPQKEIGDEAQMEEAPHEEKVRTDTNKEEWLQKQKETQNELLELAGQKKAAETHGTTPAYDDKLNDIRTKIDKLMEKAKKLKLHMENNILEALKKGDEARIAGDTESAERIFKDVYKSLKKLIYHHYQVKTDVYYGKIENALKKLGADGLETDPYEEMLKKSMEYYARKKFVKSYKTARSLKKALDTIIQSDIIDGLARRIKIMEEEFNDLPDGLADDDHIKPVYNNVKESMAMAESMLQKGNINTIKPIVATLREGLEELKKMAGERRPSEELQEVEGKPVSEEELVSIETELEGEEIKDVLKEKLEEISGEKESEYEGTQRRNALSNKLEDIEKKYLDLPDELMNNSESSALFEEVRKDVAHARELLESNDLDELDALIEPTLNAISTLQSMAEQLTEEVVEGTEVPAVSTESDEVVVETGTDTSAQPTEINEAVVVADAKSPMLEFEATPDETAPIEVTDQSVVVETKEEAVQSEDELEVARSEEAAKLLEEARKYMEHGRLYQAIGFAEKSTILDPENSQAWNLLGEMYYRVDDGQRALAAFQRAVSLDPDNVEYLGNLGYILYSMGNLDDALEYYNRGIDKSADNYELWLNKGEAHYRKGQIDEAKEAFNRSLELNPYAPESWATYGYVLEQIGEFKEASESYEKALAIAEPNTVAARVAASGKKRCATELRKDMLLKWAESL